jgi:hypothetical protein
LFASEDFLKHIGENATFSRALVKIMENIFTSKVSSVIKAQESGQYAAEQRKDAPLEEQASSEEKKEEPTSYVSHEQLSMDELLPPTEPPQCEWPAEEEAQLAVEEETGAPMSGLTLASLNGRRIEADGNVLDDDCNVIGCVVDGDPRRMAKRGARCDANGNVVFGSKSKNIGAVKLVLPEPQPVAELEEIPIPEPEAPNLKSLDGRTLDENGDILDDDGQAIGRLVEGFDKRKILFKYKAMCDAEGMVWVSGRKVPRARVEMVVAQKPAGTEDNDPTDSPHIWSDSKKKRASVSETLNTDEEPVLVEVGDFLGEELPPPGFGSFGEASVCPEQVDHMLNGDGWETCRMCRDWIRQKSIRLLSEGTIIGAGASAFAYADL